MTNLEIKKAIFFYRRIGLKRVSAFDPFEYNLLNENVLLS